jgi:hypothetical protein
MYCPSCGSEDQHSKQFCRSCGTDLRPLRAALETPDGITASAISARDEIGRAFAQKIRETKDAVGMKIVAEDVLPQIEKFLESPEERRLRRIRLGSLISFIGLGVAIVFSIIASIRDSELFVLAGFGAVAFCIGLSFIVNGMLFTVPKRFLPAAKTGKQENPPRPQFNQVETNELVLPESNQVFTSVVEETTQHLTEKQPVSRN